MHAGPSWQQGGGEEEEGEGDEAEEAEEGEEEGDEEDEASPQRGPPAMPHPSTWPPQFAGGSGGGADAPPQVRAALSCPDIER